jgi:hypothetical protein
MVWYGMVCMVWYSMVWYLLTVSFMFNILGVYYYVKWHQLVNYFTFTSRKSKIHIYKYNISTTYSNISTTYYTATVTYL